MDSALDVSPSVSEDQSYAKRKLHSAFAMAKKNKVQVSKMNPRRTGAVAAVKAYFGKPYLSWESMVKFEDVSPFILTHLQQVYFSMFLVLLSSVLGSIWHFWSNIGGLITVFGFAVCLRWFSSIRPWRGKRRVAILMAAAFCKGASVEYMIRPFIAVDKGIIITILGTTALAFGCFAVVARRHVRERDYTYSYSVLSALILVAIWLFAAVRMFGGGAGDAYPLYFFVPYGGLVCLLFYVILYSQELVVQTLRGDYHYSQHCLEFFTDIPAVPFRFISILMMELYTICQQTVQQSPKKLSGDFPE